MVVNNLSKLQLVYQLQLTDKLLQNNQDTVVNIQKIILPEQLDINNYF
jgi:hypothetical protein